MEHTVGVDAVPQQLAATTAAEAVPTLEQLEQQIRTEHEAAEAGIRDSLRHAVRAGQLLIDVKNRLSHGEFLPWVAQHCPFAQSTANIYMKIARAWRPEDSQRVGNLSLRQFAQLLARADATLDDERLGATTQDDERGELPDQSVRRVADTYLAEIKRFCVAIERAQRQPEHLRAVAKVIRSRHGDVRTALDRLDDALAGAPLAERNGEGAASCG